MTKHFPIIIRPQGIKTTPENIANWLETKTMTSNQYSPDWKKDIFLYYPQFNIKNVNSVYNLLCCFFHQTKYQQRLEIKEAFKFPIPNDFPNLSEYFVVRSMSHSQGKNYRLTKDKNNYVPFQEYISPCFPKTHEYRVLFFMGEYVTTFEKSVEEGKTKPAPEQPWNHENGTFWFSRESPTNFMKKQGIVDQLLSCPIIKFGHLIGIDLMWHSPTKQWCICEFNSCPSVTLEHILDKIKTIWDTKNA